MLIDGFVAIVPTGLRRRCLVLLLSAALVIVAVAALRSGRRHRQC
jgi:hypothetical protein